MRAVGKRIERAGKPNLLNRVRKTIREQALFLPGQHLLVAVSGGPDSVAMLSLLSNLVPSWQLRLTAVHFNYRLRGKESDGDEAFVAELCRRINIPLVVRRPAILKCKGHSSLQELARNARYAAMKSIAHEVNADRIVVGHTANDQAETMLMWMLRGAGLTGLSGMPFIRERMFVRPLLSVTRPEVLNYLQQQGLAYRKDSSNESFRYLRNRIRKKLVPVMEDIAPATVRLLQQQANLLREDERYLDQVVREFHASILRSDGGGGMRYEREAFRAAPLALRRRLVRLMLRVADDEGRAFGARTVEEVQRFMLNAERGSTLSVKRLELTQEVETIHIIRRKHEGDRQLSKAAFKRPLGVPIAIPSAVFWPGTNQKIHVQVMPAEAVRPLPAKAGVECALFDADKISEPLVVRNWRIGDRFCPSGMNGKSKKLQDYFTDKKVSRPDRDQIPLLVAPEGILWIVGQRADERFIARPTTSRCLIATVKPATGSEGAS